MMRYGFGALAASTALMMAAPAMADPLAPGQTGASFTNFSAVSGTRGTLQGSVTSQSGTAGTISGTVLEAVYLNTLGTLDFYFQVFRTGGGTDGNNEIDGFNASNFANALATYSVFAYVDPTDFDGAGGFSAVNNSFLADGTTPSGSTTTVDRSNDGAVNRVSFGRNGLSGTENSATYIFRTNAVQFNGRGNATVSNSTSFNVTAFQPIGPAVPEPATWGMMILGFGVAGAAMRRRTTTKVSFA